jgi:glycosyltransferase involved in cell wall biosynthesis
MNSVFGIVLFSLDGKRQVHSEKSAPVVHYVPPYYSLAVLFANLCFFVFHPKTCLRYLWSTLSNPEEFRAFYKGVWLAQKLSKRNIEHLHAHFANRPSDIARWVSRINGITYSISAHAQDIYTANPSLRQNLTEALFVSTCTAYNQRFLRQLSPGNSDKIYLNYHGINHGRWTFLPSDNPGKTILTVGRLVEKKGHRYLAEALALLKEQDYHFEWRIIGDGILADELNVLIKNLGIAEQVHFMGWKSSEELLELYHQSDVLIQPSVIGHDGDRDGIPNVLLEAMACGIPIVTTALSGIPEIVNGNTAMLIPEKNPNEIASALLHVYQDSDFRKRMIEKARKRVESLDASDHLRKMAELFAEKLNNHSDA